MTRQIAIDIIPYTAVYMVIMLALVAFCIVDMPANPAFAESSTMVGGVFSSMFLAWQTSVMGEYDIADYSTLASKVVFVVFTAFGNLSTLLPSLPFRLVRMSTLAYMHLPYLVWMVALQSCSTC
eukprot:COSAG06_NODE_2001_length_7869_cov_25.334363_4_plen_124_part_00